MSNQDDSRAYAQQLDRDDPLRLFRLGFAIPSNAAVSATDVDPEHSEYRCFCATPLP